MKTPDSHWWPVLRLLPDGSWIKDHLRQRRIRVSNDPSEDRQGVLCWESDGKECSREDYWKYYEE